tara:strand:- start:350 stop:496 length:147 start_codon:yes stop_codon:yes gene_type:complete
MVSIVSITETIETFLLETFQSALWGVSMYYLNKKYTKKGYLGIIGGLP